MGSMKSRLKEFILQKETLQDQERVLRATYDQVTMSACLFMMNYCVVQE